MRTKQGLEDDLPQVVADFVAAWEALGADQIANLYAQDGVAADIPAGTVLQGRESIHAYLTEFFAAFSGATVEVPTAFATKRQAAMEWVFRGSYTGQLPGFPAGAGQPITLRGFSLVEFREDELQRTVDYYDIYGMLAQLGGVPPSAGGTPEATPAG